MTPDAVRITDLATPVLPPHIEELRGAAAEYAATLSLDPAELMAAARERTGLDDFGDGWFREPLQVLCDSYRAEAGLSPIGLITQWNQVVRALSNRLRVEGRIAARPEIARVPVERPLVIAGLPRSGTTHLFNLMAEDPALRHVPYWESLEPVPQDGERGTVPDPRIARASALLDEADLALPHLKRMHEMLPERAHEDIQLLTLSCASLYFEGQAPIPRYRDWLRGTDQTPAYEYLRRTLQVLQWRRGGDRWVLKAPAHLEQLGPLMAIFPDAFVVITHREPAAVAASLCTMMTYGARMAVDPVDPKLIGGYWAARLEDLLTSCLADRDVVPPEQSIDVRFGDFMADDLAMVEAIYARAGLRLSPEAGARMRAHLADNPRNRHGAVLYDLADFGLAPDDINAALDAYRRRFDV